MVEIYPGKQRRRGPANKPKSNNTRGKEPPPRFYNNNNSNTKGKEEKEEERKIQSDTSGNIPIVKLARRRRKIRHDSPQPPTSPSAAAAVAVSATARTSSSDNANKPSSQLRSRSNSSTSRTTTKIRSNSFTSPARTNKRRSDDDTIYPREGLRSQRSHSFSTPPPKSFVQRSGNNNCYTQWSASNPSLDPSDIVTPITARLDKIRVGARVKKTRVGIESNEYFVAHELSTITSSMATDAVTKKAREVIKDSLVGKLSTGTATDLLIDEVIYHSHSVVSSRKQSSTFTSANVLSSNMPVPVTNHKNINSSMHTSSDASSYTYDKLAPVCASTSGSRTEPWASPMKNNTTTTPPTPHHPQQPASGLKRPPTDYTGADFNNPDHAILQKQQIQQQANLYLQGGTMQKYYQQYNWYNTNIKDANFDADSGTKIIQSVIEWTRTADILAASKKMKLTAFKKMLERSIDNKGNKDLPISVSNNLDNAIAMYQKEETKAVQGGRQEDVNPPLKDKDLLHIFGTILRKYHDGIPNYVFQDLTKLIVAYHLGRRTSEIHYIAPGSIQLTWEIKPGHTIPFRKISMVGVFSKGKGPTILKLSFYEIVSNDNIIYRNSTVVFLMWLERIGMIRSAYDVYLGTEVFKNDPDVFETYEDLLTKYTNAYEKNKNNLAKKLDFVADDNNNNDSVNDDDDDTVGQQKIASLIRDEDLNPHIPFKQTLWRSWIAGELLITSERYNVDDSRSVADFGQRIGYVVTKNHHFGGTIARAGNRCERGTHNMGAISADDYHSQVAGNSIGTSSLYYANHSEMRETMGAGLLMAYQQQDRVDTIIESETGSRAVYDIDGAFDTTYPVFREVEKLPTTEQFMKKHGTYLPEQVKFSGGRLELYHCPVVSCDHQNLHLGDMIVHMKEHDKGEIHEYFCSSCGEEMEYKRVATFKRHQQTCIPVGDNVKPFYNILNESKKKQAKHEIGLGSTLLRKQYCPHPGCNYHAELRRTVINHYSKKHDGNADQYHIAVDNNKKNEIATTIKTSSIAAASRPANRRDTTNKSTTTTITKVGAVTDKSSKKKTEYTKWTAVQERSFLQQIKNNGVDNKVMANEFNNWSSIIIKGKSRNQVCSHRRSFRNSLNKKGYDVVFKGIHNTLYGGGGDTRSSVASASAIDQYGPGYNSSHQQRNAPPPPSSSSSSSGRDPHNSSSSSLYREGQYPSGGSINCISGNSRGGYSSSGPPPLPGIDGSSVGGPPGGSSVDSGEHYRRQQLQQQYHPVSRGGSGHYPPPQHHHLQYSPHQYGSGGSIWPPPRYPSSSHSYGGRLPSPGRSRHPSQYHPSQPGHQQHHPQHAQHHPPHPSYRGGQDLRDLNNSGRGGGGPPPQHYQQQHPQHPQHHPPHPSYRGGKDST